MKLPLSKASLALAISIAAHLALAVPPSMSARERAVKPPLAGRAHLPVRALTLASRASVAADRRELVERARDDRRHGRLALGEFLLRASAIDAREGRRTFDLDHARALYEARLGRLRERSDLRDAVPDVFGDLHYFGRPGGTMGEALIERGGSCEPLAHLISAALFDTGHPELAKLRFYGGEGALGATHLAPVLPNGKYEHDLLAGTPAKPGGALFDAADLIEVYARAHGLSPPLAALEGAKGGAATGGAKADEPTPRQSTMGAGYPPNRDAFSGDVPLYAHSAVKAPSKAGTAVTPRAIDPADCAFFTRMAALDPPEIHIDGAAPGFDVELVRSPTGTELDRVFGVVQAVEGKVDVGRPIDRVMNHACLAALYEQAATGFSLHGDHGLAASTAEKGKKARARGEEELAKIDWGSAMGADALADLSQRYAGRAYLLLFLQGGEAVLLRLARDTSKSDKSDWGRISAIAALLVSPGSRRAAIDLSASLSIPQRIHVMHEVFRAHDHARPWSSNYAFSEADSLELVRAYRAFRVVAWGLWEGARPPHEVLDGMLAEVNRGELGRTWAACLLDYYGRNAVALHEHRADWPSFSTALKRWLRDNHFTDTELYGQTLGDVPGPT